MRRRRRLTVVLVLVLATAATAACTGSSSGSGSSNSANGTNGIDYRGADGTIVVLSEKNRAQPVSLAGTTLEGSRLDVASYRGKIVVLNVWGSWCPPCHKEAPDLQAASEELAPRGVTFVGIDTRDPDPAPARAFQRSYGISYPSLIDDGGLLLALRGTVSANAIPSTLVLDGQGRIAARISGAVTRTTLTTVVTSVLDGTPVVLPTPSPSGGSS